MSGETKEPDFYDQVADLAERMVEASLSGRVTDHWRAHAELRQLCENHQGGPLDHPFQWETLGDFTTNDHQALQTYQTAARLAKDLQLQEYLASINFAQAERWQALGESNKAWELARLAMEQASVTTDQALKLEISQWLLAEATPKDL